MSSDEIMGSQQLVWDPKVDDVEIVSEFAKELLASFELFKERQRKYGRENIADSGEYGVWVRSTDKDARLKRAYGHSSVGDMPDETIDDTWRDRLVYSGIALMVRAGKWPGAQRHSTPRGANAPLPRLDLFEGRPTPGYELGPHT